MKTNDTFISRVLRGGRSAIGGVRAVRRNSEVKKAYRFILFALFVVTLILTSLGLWGVVHYTEGGVGAGFFAKLGFWLLRVVGVVLVLLSSPLLAISLCNVLFPMFSEIPFFAGFRALCPERAAHVESQRGLSLGATIGNSLRRFFLFLLIGAGCFALGLLPVVGPFLAPPLHFYLSARMVGWEMLDPYLSQLGLSWSQQKAVVKEHAPEVLGLGVVCAPLLAIPLVGPLTFGLLQAGTAGFVREIFDEGEASTPLVPSRP